MVELRTAATVVVLETLTAMRVVEKYARSKFEDEKQHFRVLTKQAVPQEDGKICWQIPLTALVVTVSIHTHTHTHPKILPQRMV